MSERGEENDSGGEGAEAEPAVQEEEEALGDVAIRVLTLRLLRRICNAAAGAHRAQWKSLLNLERDTGSIAIRRKLKVEQLNTASKDACVSFQPKKVLGMSCGTRMHALLCIIAEEAESEIGKLTKEQMQALMKAYHAADADIAPGLLRTNVPKPDLTAALVAILKNTGSKLLRYDPTEFK